MARVKHFNKATSQWEYADESFGLKGDPGDDYILTEDDKAEIAQQAAQAVDLSSYATEEYVRNKIAEAELGGEEVDLSGYAQKSELPTKVSQLQNDSGFITGYTETDPTVPSWAKQASKPSYTAAEVGARPSTWTPTYTDVGADKSGAASSAVSAHNTQTDAHNDIRLELKDINDRLNAFFDSDDKTLDELSEIVTYITSNKALIDSVTTSKVSVSDIINNLTTNVSNKPLSAAQGVVLKGLIDTLNSGKLDASALSEAINTALAQAKASGEFDGKDGATGGKGDTGATGQRGTGLLPVTTAPSSYTTAVGGITPKYRMAINTIKTQAGVTEVILGDTVRYSYYHYPIAYLDASYAYMTTRVSIRGETGATGKTAYQHAQDGGYTGTEAEFSALLATPIVTPQMYGAVGDGVTDDTAAFETALSENDNVFVPEGNYLLTRALDITYKKGLFSNDGQRATIHFNGNGSVVNLGRLSVFRNINIRIKKAFVGTVFNTHNHNVDSGQSALESRVEDVNVFFEVASPNATLIGITVDSGTDPDNIPRLKGVCYQTYHDICVEYGSSTYGYGIKMELIQGREFTEETKEGFPWITHIDYDDIFLGSPHTAIKAGVTNTSGAERFNRVSMGTILFNNVSTQYRDSESTQIFLDLDNFGGFFTKCIGWDYHPLTWAGKKVNIIGENVTACLTNCQMAFGAEFLECCDFTAETEYTVSVNPEYFVAKYFPGSVLSEGYDGIDAKIDAKLTGEYVAAVAEEKVNEILYSGYANVLDNPLTQIKVGQRWSSSAHAWTEGSAGSTQKTTIIIPIVKGGNIIRWTPNTYKSDGSYDSMYFFNTDDLSDGISAGKEFLVSTTTVGNVSSISVDNPSGYKYVCLPFGYYTNISSETMTITINREISGNEGQSFTEYLKESVIDPAIAAHNTNASAHADIRNALNSKADKSEGSFYIEGAGTTDATAKTSTWTGTSNRITSYYDGLAIRYKIGVEGQNTVTLNINNLGAKIVYRFSTTKLTTHFPVGSIITLVYHEDLNDGCWITNDYDSNTNTQQRVYVTTANTEYPITTRYNTTTGATYYAEYGRYSTGVTLNPSTNTITATAFKGKLTGNADTATKATQDASGNNIATTYAKVANAETWTFTLEDGSTVTKKVVLG